MSNPDFPFAKPLGFAYFEMMELDLLKKIGLALALGLLVGIEREFSQRREGEPLFAGSRTFALLALLGAISGYLATQILRSHFQFCRP